nr:hypothetical protein B0A51_10451 [Rachicladosporium sp. CCFEE 5018]
MQRQAEQLRTTTSKHTSPVNYDSDPQATDQCRSDHPLATNCEALSNDDSSSHQTAAPPGRLIDDTANLHHSTEPTIHPALQVVSRDEDVVVDTRTLEEFITEKLQAVLDNHLKPQTEEEAKAIETHRWAELLYTEKYMDEAIAELRRRGVMSPSQSSGFPSEAGGYAESVEDDIKKNIQLFAILPWLAAIPQGLSMQRKLRDVKMPMTEVSQDEDHEPGEEPKTWESESMRPRDDAGKRVKMRVDSIFPKGRSKWTWNEEVRNHALTFTTAPEVPLNPQPKVKSWFESDAPAERALSKIPDDDLLHTMNSLKTYRPQLRKHLAGQDPGLFDWSADWSQHDFDLVHLREGMRLTADLLETEWFVADALAEFKRRGIMLDTQESGFPSELGAYPASVEERLIERAPRCVIEPWLNGLPQCLSVEELGRNVAWTWNEDARRRARDLLADQGTARTV